MRKTAATLLALLLVFSALGASAGKELPPVYTWDDVRAQIDQGAATVQIPNDMTVPAGETIGVDGTLTIEGGGCTLSGGLTVSGGVVIFKDTALTGANGIDSDDGYAALTVLEGAAVVLSGRSSAIGGRAGQFGAKGGDGVVLEGEGSGLILRGTAYASGGVGREQGGHGVWVKGCGASVILTDNASAIGSASMHTGGSGLYAPACASVTLSGMAQLAGGNGTNDSGSGLTGVPCEACEKTAQIAIKDTAVLVGGIGYDGGAGLNVERAEAGDTADVTLSDGCMFFGGSGVNGGAAIRAVNSAIAVEGAPQCYGGGYSGDARTVVQFYGCALTGESSITQIDGAKIAADPTQSVAEYVHVTLQQVDEAARFRPVETALSADEMTTSLDGLKVEKNAVTQVYLNGSNYKTTLWNATYEKKLSFKERLMQAEDGVRLVLIAQESPEYLTFESTPAALKKYVSLGVTELALTMIEPVYYERVLSLEGLLEAMEAYGMDEIGRVMIGTADDCVIFRTAKGNVWDYQETLLPELLREVN